MNLIKLILVESSDESSLGTTSANAAVVRVWIESGRGALETTSANATVDSSTMGDRCEGGSRG